jgi:hypothetical protein
MNMVDPTSTGKAEEILRNAQLCGSKEMSIHDLRLYKNDPVVATIAKSIAQAILEFGVKKTAAGFRAGLVLARYAATIKNIDKDF